MSRAQGPYSRHYWELVDDPKFATIYPDDHHYATWSRLLMIADQAWPASAHLPSTARRVSIRHLAAADLIELLPDGRYRIVGMQAEREKRSAHAKQAAEVRWDAPSNAPSNASGNAQVVPAGMPSREEKSKATEEQSIGHAPAVDEDANEDDAAVALQHRTGQFPGERIVGWLNDISEAHSEARLTALIGSTPMAGRNVRDYLRAIQDTLRSQDHAAEKAERADELRRNAAKRAPVKSHEEREAEYRALKRAEAEMVGGLS